MATFKAVVRWPRADGFYSVYIRVTPRRQTHEIIFGIRSVVNHFGGSMPMSAQVQWKTTHKAT